VEQARRLRRLPWLRLGSALFVVTLGFSQVTFNLIAQRELSWFPRGGGFHLWVILWVQLLPFAIVLLLDGLLLRLGPRHWLFSGWRALLYVLFAASYLRQFSIYHSEVYDRYLALVPPLWLYAALTAVTLALSLKARRLLDTVAGVLGLLALYVTGSHLCESGYLRAQDRARPAAASVPSLPVCPETGLSVYLIVFDELSYQALASQEGVIVGELPHLAALAAEGAWFTRATANHDRSRDSLPSLLTGKILPSPDSPSVFRLLAPSYPSWVIETDMGTEGWLRARDDDLSHYRGKFHLLNASPLLSARYVFQNLFHSAFWRDRRIRSLHNSPAIHTTLFAESDLFLRLVSDRPSQQRLVYWHSSVPHAPFIYDGSGRRHGRATTHFAVARGQEPPREVFDTYLEQVRLADSLVARLVSQLERDGLDDESVVVVTADHGVRVWGQLERNLDLAARIPLIIRAPGLAPAVHDTDVQLVDLVPTLLDLLGCRYDAFSFDGVSAFATARPDRVKAFHLRKRMRYVHDPARGAWLPAGPP
jgi:hypothetical protein